MIGRVRLKERTVKLRGRPVAATITRRADRWFVSFTVERGREIPSPRPVRRLRDVAGVDLGVTNAASFTTGQPCG
jgi:putative transposase